MLTVHPGTALRGAVNVPGDKSISHRAAIFAALADGVSRVSNYSPAEDCASTLRCLRLLRVRIQRDGDQLVIDGRPEGFEEPQEVLDAGNSGTTFRLLLGALAGMDLYAVLTGDVSLRGRPMDRVLEPLSRMGLRYLARAGGRLAPVSLHGGRLDGVSYQSPVASAQLKSALLLAGLRAEGATTVVEPAPSRDHTERMLSAMGAEVEREGYRVTMRPSRLQALDISVPGDPSSAAFLLGAALVVPGSEVVTTGIDLNPTRTGFVEALRRMGGRLMVEQEGEQSGEPVGDVRARPSELHAVEIGGAEVPSLIDELPLLAVLATQAEGTTVIRDASELRVKETDRIGVLVEGLRRMGAQIHERADGMVIEGPAKLRGAEVDPRGDHRLAMALSVAALVAEGDTVIRNARCVGVSYPGYWEDLEGLRGGGGPRLSERQRRISTT